MPLEHRKAIRHFFVFASLASFLPGCAKTNSSLFNSSSTVSSFVPSSPSSGPFSDNYDSSCSNSSSLSSNSADGKGLQLLNDQKFSTGFYLREWTTVNGGPVVRHLNYGGTVADSDTPTWTMARWWDPYDFKNAAETEIENGWRYSDKSSYCEMNLPTGELTMNLNSWTEYQEKFGGSRSSASQNWSHFLIEQSPFLNVVKASDLTELWADLTFNIKEVTLFDSAHFDASLHTAQLFWYLTLANRIDKGATDQGVDGDYLWFGIPLYDYRYNLIETYHNVDAGVVGSTNKMIYSMSNSEYLPVSSTQGITLGKEYGIHINILPFLKDAYVYGVTHGALQNTNFSRMYLSYMNFGWELPGSFEITSTIRNLSLTAILSE